MTSIASVKTLPPGAASGAAANRHWLRALQMTAGLDSEPEHILPVLIDELGSRFGESPALLSEREKLTYRALADRVNRYARWALDHGLVPGDVVGLMMPNRPDYMAFWLGITRVGGIVALLNTNLTGTSLAHCITIAAPKHVVVAAELLSSYWNAAEQLAAKPMLWVHGASAGALPRIDEEIEHYRATTLTPSERPPVTLSHRALLIYTSGTTGLPKAANVSHHRLMSWSHWFAGMMGAEGGDRMYDCLPMYHSVGGVVAPLALLVNGGSVMLADRFSTSRFWKDIVQWDCTIFQYIGELCRYLVKSSPGETEARHRLRLACGNGLRADVWTEFQSRFRIPRILEFYAATENNFSLFNAEGKPGAIGRIPNFLAHRFPAALVRSDLETGELIRDAQGLCARCAPGETGEAIGKIVMDRSGPATRFEGYTSAADSERKLIRNVFTEGDVWLRTGDLMRMDEKGYFFFVDRLGDTFRWKGENVATSEAADIIGQCPGVLEACVYGVKIPGAEGRAGMAALVVDPSFSPAVLHEYLHGRLPDYAQPRILRIVAELPATETFKNKKYALMGEGYDPAAITDALYLRDAAREAFVPLDASIFAAMEAEQIRL